MSCKNLSHLSAYIILAAIAVPCIYFLEDPVFTLMDRAPVLSEGIIVLIAIFCVNGMTLNLAFNIKGRLVISFLAVIYYALTVMLVILLQKILNLENDPDSHVLMRNTLTAAVSFPHLFLLECFIRSKLSKVSALIKKA